MTGLIRNTEPILGPWPVITCPGSGRDADTLHRCPVCKCSGMTTPVPEHTVNPNAI